MISTCPLPYLPLPPYFSFTVHQFPYTFVDQTFWKTNCKTFLNDKRQLINTSYNNYKFLPLPIETITQSRTDTAISLEETFSIPDFLTNFKPLRTDFGTNRIGIAKVQSAKKTLLFQTPEIQFPGYHLYMLVESLWSVDVTVPIKPSSKLIVILIILPIWCFSASSLSSLI